MEARLLTHPVRARNTIIAGNFALKQDADVLISRLLAGGTLQEDIHCFALNPPGQHGLFPIGGDQDADKLASGGDSGALKGAAIGAVVGMGAGIAAASLLGPAAIVGGAAVGAYTGSVAGAMNSMGDKVDPEAGEDGAASPARQAGVMVAVRAAGPVAEDRTIGEMRASQARTVERTQGEWAGGQWVDFDPLQPPNLVAGHSAGN